MIISVFNKKTSFYSPNTLTEYDTLNNIFDNI